MKIEMLPVATGGARLDLAVAGRVALADPGLDATVDRDEEAEAPGPILTSLDDLDRELRPLR
ncbi:MAG: hypothetical protein KC486_03055 [Myxococcales bacterium]|nr:hypothetical protein [Myxococcales bacterium]